MTINKTVNGNETTLAVEGRIDTTTAPQLEAEIDAIGDCTSLILNFAGVEYISSAGLRVLLKAQKLMNNQGKMVLKNVGEDIMEVFDITGFADLLTIE